MYELFLDSKLSNRSKKLHEPPRVLVNQYNIFYVLQYDNVFCLKKIMFFEIYVYKRIYNNNYMSVETLNGLCRLMHACHMFFQTRPYFTTSEGFYEITVKNLSKLFSFK